MKIALVGATGSVGTRLTSELTRRVHHVTAIARHPEKLQRQTAVSPVSGDVQNEKSLATVLAGHDAVIHSVKFLSMNASKIIAATKAAKVPRLLVVGGAGSLEVTPGLTLVNTPDFPAEYKPETLAGVEFLNVLRGEKELDWTFLSPSYLFAPGERTGKFRLGKDELLVAADGQSHISTEDFAIALVDEWNSRSTLANDSRSGTDDKSMHELSGGAKSQSSTTNDMTTKEVGNGFSRNQSTRHRSGPRCD
jgi:uncharacterized protein